MKTGIEMIAEARKRVKVTKSSRIYKINANLEHFEICNVLGNPMGGLEALAEAGALIAAEIDRLNNLKQG